MPMPAPPGCAVGVGDDPPQAASSSTSSNDAAHHLVCSVAWFPALLIVACLSFA
jgi:hypothetical protein